MNYKITWWTHTRCRLFGHIWEERPVTKQVATRYGGYRWRDFTNYTCKRCGRYVWYRSDAPTLWEQFYWWRNRMCWKMQDRLRPRPIPSDDELPF